MNYTVDRITLRVLGPNRYLLEDQAAVLTGGLAVSHKYRKAFGCVQPIPLHHLVAEGESPPQVGIACIVYLEDEVEDLKIASRQYGQSRNNRIARYLVMGPPGSWVTILSTSIGLSIGFWPVVRTVSEKGSTLGLLFLGAWSIFYVPVVARSIIAVWHRRWASALVAGFLMYMVVFWAGGGDTYLVESIRDILDKMEMWIENIEVRVRNT